MSDNLSEMVKPYAQKLNIGSILTPFSEYQLIVVFADCMQLALVHELAMENMDYEKTIFFLSTTSVTASKGKQVLKSNNVVVPNLPNVGITKTIDSLLVDTLQNKQGDFFPDIQNLSDILERVAVLKGKILEPEATVKINQIISEHTDYLSNLFSKNRLKYEFPLVIVSDEFKKTDDDLNDPFILK